MNRVLKLRGWISEVATRKLIFGIVVMVVYLTIRSIIYRFLPVSSYSDWVWRDFIMNAPRLFCALAILAVVNRSDLSRGEAFNSKVYFGAFLAVLGIIAADFFFGGSTVSSKLTWLQFLQVGIVSGIVVTFFEELLFRGLIFESARAKFGPGRAIFLSAFLFMVLHIGAQPERVLPLNFAYGIILAMFRSRGFSLIGAMAFHFLTSLPEPFIGGVPEVGFFYFLYLGTYLILALTFLQLLKIAR